MKFEIINHGFDLKRNIISSFFNLFKPLFEGQSKIKTAQDFSDYYSNIQVTNPNINIKYFVGHEDNDEKYLYLGAALTVINLDEKNMKIDWMMVNKNIRREGLGSKIIDEIKKYCSENEINEITLKSRTEENTQSFWKKCGFTLIDPNDDEPWFKFESNINNINFLDNILPKVNADNNDSNLKQSSQQQPTL